MAAWPVMGKISWNRELGYWGTWDAGLLYMSVCCCRGGRCLISLTVQACVSGRGALIQYVHCHAEIYILFLMWQFNILVVCVCVFCVSVFCHKVWLVTKRRIMWQDLWSRLGLFTEGCQDATKDRMGLKTLESAKSTGKKTPMLHVDLTLDRK